jgi:flagellin
MLSINTNYSASLALQSLQATQKDLEDVQGRITTGLKVADASDNGAVFAIAQGQRARLTSLTSIREAMDRTGSAISVALAAGTAVGDILLQLKSKAVSAQAQDLTTNQRNALQADFDNLRNQINQIVGSAQFNGLNLIAAGGSSLNVAMSDISTGTAGRQVASTPVAGLVPGLSSYVVGNGGVTAADGTTFTINSVAIGTAALTATMTVQQYLDEVTTATAGRVTASYDQSNGQFTYRAAEAVDTTNELGVAVAGGGTARTWLGHGIGATAVTSGASTMSITDWDWSAGGSGALATVSTAANLLASAGSALTTASNLDTAIVAINTQMAAMGSQAKSLEAQNNFIGKLRDVVEEGVSNLVDADLAKESARLQSLQIKQQLGTQALSIANQAPQYILSLFRG